MKSLCLRPIGPILATLGLIVLSPGGRPLLSFTAPPAQGGGESLHVGDFAISHDARGLTGLSHASDPHQAQVLAPGGRLAPVVKYRVEGGDWFDVFQATVREVSADGRGLTYTSDVSGTVLKSVQEFRTDGTVLDWTIRIENRMEYPVQIGDAGVLLPWRAPGGEDPETLFERSWTKHQFVSGHGSFIYFVRPNGLPPYLVMTTLPGTTLEYTASPGGRGAGFQALVHSVVTGGGETRGSWRQPHTDARLGPKGTPSATLEYGVRFRWAGSYDRMRDVFFEEGAFDVRVVPGMTVPEDLTAEVALRSKARVEALQPEFPGETTVVELGERKPGYRLYRLSFRRLGENRLTLVHDGGRQTHLEFFVTEPIETLIKTSS